MKDIRDLQNLPEIVVVDKPFGISSFDVIRIIQKHFGKIKIGHAGTLDPRATGLMILGTGKGTKKLHELTGLNKTYIADIFLGKKTTTGDLEGEIVEEKKHFKLSKQEVEEKIITLLGTQDFEVSLFSALKKDGKPLYQYAREGKDIEKPIRSMTVYKAHMLDMYSFRDGYIVRVRFDVSKGTYIRSLGEALGERLQIPATLSSLRRIQIGTFGIEKSYYLPLEWIQDFKNNRKIRKNGAF